MTVSDIERDELSDWELEGWEGAFATVDSWQGTLEKTFRAYAEIGDRLAEAKLDLAKVEVRSRQQKSIAVEHHLASTPKLAEWKAKAAVEASPGDLHNKLVITDRNEEVVRLTLRREALHLKITTLVRLGEVYWPPK